MSKFVNTISVLGDDAVIDSIIERTITEFKDDIITSVGNSAFMSCTELVTVDLPSVKNIEGNAFNGCRSLASVNLPNVGGGLFAGTFYGCSSITKLAFSEVTETSGNVFYGCTALMIVDFFKLTKVSEHNLFAGCSSLAAFIIRTGSVATLYYGTLGLNSNTYIYVPRALIDSYKAATNWSTYADQFRALEDYTVDGTTTGELDETKI